MRGAERSLLSLLSGLGETSDDLLSYAVDGMVPPAALLPRTVEELVEALRRAHANGLAVSPRGGGTKVALGNVPRRLDVVLGTRYLNAVMDHQPADLTVTVQAGLPLASLQATLREHGQFLPLQSPLPSRATIGGILATNTCGPLRLAYGTARDWLIGVQVVSADGTVTKAGGKVVKNVTGFDLNKLHVGALGTLAVIVQASLKVAPLPPVLRTITARFSSIAAATDTALEVERRGIGPLASVVLDRGAVRRLGQDFKPLPQGESLLALELGGRQATVERREADVRVALADGGALHTQPLDSKAEAFWQGVVDLGWGQADGPAISVRCGVRPTETAHLCQRVQAAFQSPALALALAVQPAVGVLRATAWGEGEGVMPPAALAARVASLREALTPSGGHVVVERCPASTKALLDVWGEQSQSVSLMRRIKEQFDPRGVLNPGRFVGGI